MECKRYYEREVDRVALESPLCEYQYIQIRQSRAFMEKYLAANIALHWIPAGGVCASMLYKKHRFQSPDNHRRLHVLRWWDWDAEKVTHRLDAIVHADIDKLRYAE